MRLAVGRGSSRAAPLLDLLRLGFLVWAAVAGASGDVGGAIVLVVTFAVLVGVRRLRLPAPLDLALIVALVLQSLGKVEGFWTRYEWWDTLVHFALPAAVAPIVLLLALRLRLLPDPSSLDLRRAAVFTAVVTLMLATTGGAIYEEYEWASDSWRGTHYQPNNQDTMTDMSMNLLGGLVGGCVMGLTLAARRRRQG